MSHVIRKPAMSASLKGAVCCLAGLWIFPSEASRKDVESIGYLRIPQHVIRKRQAIFEDSINPQKAKRAGSSSSLKEGSDSARQEPSLSDKPLKQNSPENSPAPAGGIQAADISVLPPFDSPIWNTGWSDAITHKTAEDNVNHPFSLSDAAARRRQEEKDVFRRYAAPPRPLFSAKPFLLEEKSALLLKELGWAHVKDDSGRFSHIDIRSPHALARAAELSKTYILPDRIVQRLAEISHLHNEGPEYGLGMTENHKITAALTSAGVYLRLYSKKETEALLQYIQTQGWNYFVRQRIQAIENLGEIAQNQMLPRETVNYMSKLTFQTKHPDVRRAAFVAFSKTAANHPPDAKALRRAAAGMKLLREKRAAPEEIDDKPFQQLAQAVPLPPELINELSAQRSSGARFADDFFKRLTALAEKNEWPAESLVALEALTEEGDSESCPDLFQSGK